VRSTRLRGASELRGRRPKDLTDMPARRPESKQRILQAATELFAVNGFHGTGVAEIGARAGLGRGALYHHITNKQKILYEVLSVCADDEMLDYADAVADADVPADEKLRSLSRQLMRAIANHRLEWTVFFREFAALEGEYRTDVQRRRAHYERLWNTVIDEGRATGVFRQVDPVVVNGVLGMYNYAYLWLEPGGRLAPEEIADAFCNVLLNGLAA
jgi:AcrR family transcriptional regulator